MGAGGSVTLDTPIPRDTVQRCVSRVPRNTVPHCAQETPLFLSYSLAKKQALNSSVKTLSTCSSMKFKSKYVLPQNWFAPWIRWPPAEISPRRECLTPPALLWVLGKCSERPLAVISPRGSDSSPARDRCCLPLRRARQCGDLGAGARCAAPASDKEVMVRAGSSARGLLSALEAQRLLPWLATGPFPGNGLTWGCLSCRGRWVQTYQAERTPFPRWLLVMLSCFPSEDVCFRSPWPLTLSAASQLLLGQPAVPGLAHCSGTSWRETFSKDWILLSSCSRIGLYVVPGRVAGEELLQTPKGQVEEKKKGEARMEEEPNRTSNVAAGPRECLCVLYLLICLLSHPRAILTDTPLPLFPMPLPGSEEAV